MVIAGFVIVKWLALIVCGGYVVSVRSVIVTGYAPAMVLRSNEICSSTSNGRRAYLELGDSGVLLASNVSTAIGVPNKQFISGSDSIKQNATQFQCSLELVTCSSCIIKVTISFLNFSNSEQCRGSPFYESDDVTSKTYPNKLFCNCDYLAFAEPPYDASVSGHRHCGGRTPLQFTSQTRSLSIKYLYRTDRSGAVFKLDYTSERNVDELIGYSSSFNATQRYRPTSNHFMLMTSPFFPGLYPRDYTKEHRIVCNDAKLDHATNEPCRIRVIFTDFQLAIVSTMEFFDWNGKQIDVFSGAVFRPPVIISTGPSLLIRFYANGGIGLGYRANIDFMTETQVQNASVSRPFTDCGGYVETLGGAITMMNMVENETEPRNYDCIWLIRPSSQYLHLKTHLSLRLEAFNQFAGRSELVIRQGQTSRNQDLKRIQWSESNTKPELSDYIVPMAAGFYVTFNGIFGASSRLALVYTAFSYMDCYIGSDFLCKNHKCIPGQLQCDGFDHCGDNSDEPDSCKDEWEREPFDRRWYSHTPNYYFPKMDRYPDLKTATIVFFISSLGLIILISALVILLYKMGTRARHQRELQGHLQTISELLDNSVRIEEHSPEEPPAYDPPPDYEEVIKVGMDDEMHHKDATRKSDRQPNRTANTRSRQNSQSYQNAILEVIMPPETPTSSILLLDSLSPCTSPLPAINIDALIIPFGDALVGSRLLENTTSTSSTSSAGIIVASQTLSCIPERAPPEYCQQTSPSVQAEPSTTSDRSSSYFNGLVEDLMDITFSEATSPAISASNLLQDLAPEPSPLSQQKRQQHKHLWNSNPARIQRTWLTIRHDEPMTVPIRHAKMTTAIDEPIVLGLGYIRNSSVQDFINDTEDPIQIKSIDQSKHQLQPFGSSKSLDEHLVLNVRCIECGGIRQSDGKTEECSSRALSEDIEKCRCGSPMLIGLTDLSRRSSMQQASLLRRSSSAENFPLLLKEATAAGHKSLTNIVDASC